MSQSPRPPRVLVADDELPAREFASRALLQDGHDVVSVEDGLQALDAMARDEFDILLTDIVMPGLDGISLALKVSKDHPNTKIVLMTGYAAEQQRAYGLESLIHAVIAKPFSLRQLVATVNAALGNPERRR